jgi:hypothetical protein
MIFVLKASPQHDDGWFVCAAKRVYKTSPFQILVASYNIFFCILFLQKDGRRYPMCASSPRESKLKEPDLIDMFGAWIERVLYRVIDMLACACFARFKTSKNVGKINR